MFNNSQVVGQLLSYNTCYTQHSKTSILQFLGLHDVESLRILGLELGRVKTNVTWVIVITELEEWLSPHGSILWALPTRQGTVGLGKANAENKALPEGTWYLGKVINGRSLDGCIEEEGRSFNCLANEEPYSGKHGNASVCNFSLAEALNLIRRGILKEAKRIERSNRCEGSGKSSSELRREQVKKEEKRSGIRLN